MQINRKKSLHAPNRTELKCARCRRMISARASEDSNKIVFKVRLFTQQLNGGPVFVKCRHCGHMVRVPSLRST